MRRHRMIRTRSDLENRLFILLVFSFLVLALLLILRFQGMSFGPFPADGSLGNVLVVLSLLMVFYFGATLWMTGYLRHHRSVNSKSKMRTKAARICLVFIQTGRCPSKYFCKQRKR